jgi:hypothetical protein
MSKDDSKELDSAKLESLTDRDVKSSGNLSAMTP